MKFLSGLVLGAVLCGGAWTLSAQSERALHPRIAKAIEALKDARAYMQAAPHDFGGHRVAAIADCEKAVKQLREALKYREMQDRKKMK